jgi:tyrosine decarboxylase/aspartate 1-decarboxylase
MLSLQKKSMYWPIKSANELREAVLNALKGNRNYRSSAVLGLPASHLDPKVFPPDASFLNEAPFARVFMENPNHIGCHTLIKGESAFEGTHELERDLLRICAEEMMGASPDGYDGYVASGGTEANIQALWVYRNMFMEEEGATARQVGVIYSSDSHYSFYKAGNLLQIKTFEVAVHPITRQMSAFDFKAAMQKARDEGVRYLVVVFNMGTTMFGAVDDAAAFIPLLVQNGMPFRVHIDGAFGGFVYPFVANDRFLTFVNPAISSITIDAHKMLQAPYGTGIFMTRKGLMKYTHTGSASYVMGGDATLSGSRSGANLVAAWMILYSYGSVGWKVKIERLLQQTSALCKALDEAQIAYFRNPMMNLVAMRATAVPHELVDKYLLVPDKHGADAEWVKIVVMDHVKNEHIEAFIADLRAHTLVMADY